MKLRNNPDYFWICDCPGWLLKHKEIKQCPQCRKIKTTEKVLKARRRKRQSVV